MPIAEYPLPSVNSTYPIPSVVYQMPERFQVGVTQYDDGGRDTKLQNGGNGIKSWVLTYAVLSAAAAAILDAHALAAKLGEDGPSAITFNFRDPTDGTLYAGCRYLQYNRPSHVKRWIQSREIVIVKYP